MLCFSKARPQRNMQKLIIVPVLFFLVNGIVAQENSAWVDSILNTILLNQTAVYNESFVQMKNTSVQFARTDTSINCRWTRPKFLDNIYHSAFDGVLTYTLVHFDTSTNVADFNFIDFKTPKYDEVGNYLSDTIIFLIKKSDSSHGAGQQNSGLIRKLKGTRWQNNSIILNGLTIELDSCHQLFRLQFDDDFTFHQFYGNNQKICSTQSMHEEITVGLEGDFTYQSELQGHYSDIFEGIWQIEERQLRLINLEMKRMLIFEIEKLNSKELHLKLKGLDYRVMMKKASL